MPKFRKKPVVVEAVQWDELIQVRGKRGRYASKAKDIT